MTPLILAIQIYVNPIQMQQVSMETTSGLRVVADLPEIILLSPAIPTCLPIGMRVNSTGASRGAIADHYFQSSIGASGQNDMYLARGAYVFTDNTRIPWHHPYSFR